MTRIILFTIITLFLIFFNIGKWIDITDTAIKSDIIVCLGGGTPHRVKKAILLYKDNYSNYNKLLLLGENRDNKKYIDNYHPHINYTSDSTPKNTKEEILYIKKYMLSHHLKSAIIVTDPAHSRRVSLFLSFMNIKGDEDMKFIIVSSDVQWWDKSTYYTNKKARNFVMNEMIKIPYNFFIYLFLDQSISNKGLNQ